MTAAARPEWSDCVVVESVDVAERVRRITLERTRPTGRRAPAGAHIDVEVLLGDTRDVRSYSIVESDDVGARFTLTVLRTQFSRGGSDFMHGLAVGDAIRATQPLQDFPLGTGADGYLLLAGGIGITALMEAAKQLRRRGSEYRLVYVGRRRAMMAYLDTLHAEHGNRFEARIDDEGTGLDVGDLIAEVTTQTGRQELVMCGPVRLMDAVRRAWETTGRSMADLRFETFGSSGWFDAQEFEVTIPELGVTATVGPNQTVLEALSAVGAELMWDCRKGECGLCELKVEAAEGVIDHRDVFLSDQQKERGDRICVCVSRAVATVPGGSARVVLAIP